MRREDYETWVDGEVWSAVLLEWFCYLVLVGDLVFLIWNQKINSIIISSFALLMMVAYRNLQDRRFWVNNSKCMFQRKIKFLDKLRTEWNLTRYQFLEFENNDLSVPRDRDALNFMLEESKKMTEVWKPKRHFLERFYGSVFIAAEVDVSVEDS